MIESAAGGGASSRGEAGSADARSEYLMDLGLALSRFGSTSQRVEEALELTARSFGVRGEFFALPTSVFGSIGEGAEQRALLRRVEPGDPDLASLIEVDRVFNDVADGVASVDDGRARLRAIEEARERYGPLTRAASFGAVGACAAVILGGGWRESLGAGLVGLAVGVLVIAGERVGRVRRLTDFLSGFAAAVFAGLVSRVVGPIDAGTVVLAGLIVLVPGLTLTLAMSELAVRNVVAGTARLVGALTVFVAIGFGIGIGNIVAGEIQTRVPAGLAWWATPIALCVSACAVMVLFRARPRELPLVLLGAFAVFYGARLGAWALEPRLGVAVGAFLVGVSGNVVARFWDRPSTVVVLPGILMIVPGGLGLRGTTELIGYDAAGGLETATTVLVVGAGLVMGLLLASAAVPPRKVL